jgi:hypothetical protein
MISKSISYEKTTSTYVAISGWGILLIFGADQGLLQTVAPYPPFGLITLTALISGSYLMFLGIYSSAILVSKNNELRTTIYKRALESNLLHAIGHAEMEKEIQKTVERIRRDTDTEGTYLDPEIQLNENELKKYLDFVIRSKKGGKFETLKYLNHSSPSDGD